MEKHVAYNLDTGEVITTTCANHLKRCVARAQRWAVAWGYSAGRWVFAHGKDAVKRVCEKAAHQM